MNDELFELCKEVSKITNWDEQLFYWSEDFDTKIVDSVFIGGEVPDTMQWRANFYPLYTSDYLLEKLPGNIGVEKIYSGEDTAYIAFSIEFKNTPKEWKLNSGGNTPLKALLKLTLALHEAGELK